MLLQAPVPLPRPMNLILLRTVVVIEFSASGNWSRTKNRAFLCSVALGYPWSPTLAPCTPARVHVAQNPTFRLVHYSDSKPLRFFDGVMFIFTNRSEENITSSNMERFVGGMTQLSSMPTRSSRLSKSSH